MRILPLIDVFQIDIFGSAYFRNFCGHETRHIKPVSKENNTSVNFTISENAGLILREVRQVMLSHEIRELHNQADSFLNENRLLEARVLFERICRDFTGRRRCLDDDRNDRWRARTG